jgi:Icc protein
MDSKKLPSIQSIETKHMAERADLFRALRSLDRRSFLKVSAAAFGAVAAKGLLPPHSFQPVGIAHAETPTRTVESFRFAYISDSHLYDRKVNDRFVNALLRAVDDVNGMSAQILKNVKAPLRMMVGEHDWYFDLGEKWRSLFGQPQYSFDHKGVHFVVLNSVVEKDFWTARGLTPMQRMRTVAGLDNGVQSSFTVGTEGRSWLENDLRGKPPSTPLVVFSHSPLYKLYKPWNFWTDDAEDVQAILRRFQSVVVFHGHTHQMLTNRIGNIHFQGFLSTAWPWPYAPQGLPELTVEMGRPDPFDPNDGCGNGSVLMHPDGLADIVQNLWNRNPVTISRNYTLSNGKHDKPPVPALRSF